MGPGTRNLFASVGGSGGENKERGLRSERISVGGGDDSVVRIQLAARWAETFGPEEGDSLLGALRRFRQAFEYLDSVTHGIDPVESWDGEERRAPAPPTRAPEPAAPSLAPAAPPARRQPPVVSSADQPLAPEAGASTTH